MKNINLNLGQLYVLSAPPASGKSTLLRNNNIPDSMVVSADTLRSQIYGDVSSYDEDGVYNNPLHNDEAGVHRILRENIRMRLKEKLTTFVDVTAVTDKDRKNYVKLAEEFGVECKILIFDVEQDTCLKQDKLRENRVGKDVIERFFNKFQRESKFPFEVINSDSNLVFIPNTLPHNRFDIIGDTHGRLDEFIEFATTKLGYQFDKKTGNLFHIEGRNLLFLGDFVDRGSQTIEMLQFVQNLQKFGHKAIVGNHENKLINFYKTLNKENRIHVASRAAAQTAMEFSKLPKQKRDGLYNFLVSLPHYYVKDNFAFTHAGVQSFSPESIPRSFAIYGDLKRRNDTTDTDKIYESLFKAGVNEYYLIRGHNELTNEEQSIVLSLDNNVAFTDGSMQALKLDQAIKLKNEDNYANLNSLILSQEVDYNYEEVLEEQFKINSLMQTLKKNKLASCKTNDTGFLHLWKYSKNVFYQQSWSKDPALLKCRGIVTDWASNIVVHPFDKVFNYSEPNHLKQETATDIPDEKQVIVTEKLNGYLGLITKHPFKENQLLITTQGTFEKFRSEDGLVDSTYAGYIRDLVDKKLYGRLMKYLHNNDVTLMFEVIHPEDKNNHIVHYDEDMEGLHLIGVRGKNFNDQVLPEEEMDKVAEEIGVPRADWHTMTFKKAKDLVEKSELEGYMIRDAETNDYICKFKTPHYLIIKFLGRMGKSNVNKMYNAPEDFKKGHNVEEEFFPLVDYFVENIDKNEFINMNEDQRKEMVKEIISEMRSYEGDVKEFLENKSKNNQPKPKNKLK